MINWKSIEKDGLPEKSDQYLTCRLESPSKNLQVLSFSVKHQKWNYIDLFEKEETDKYAIHGITHWAEINLPDAPRDALKHACITVTAYVHTHINLSKG